MHTKCVSARQTGSAHAQQNAVPGVINSMTHPDAWQWLNRACKKQIVPEEVYNDWMSGGARRNQLLANFVQRVHRPGDSQQANLLRLEAFIKIRQCTKDVTKSLKGYEWHTTCTGGSRTLGAHGSGDSQVNYLGTGCFLITEWATSRSTTVASQHLGGSVLGSKQLCI